MTSKTFIRIKCCMSCMLALELPHRRLELLGNINRLINSPQAPILRFARSILLGSLQNCSLTMPLWFQSFVYRSQMKVALHWVVSPVMNKRRKQWQIRLLFDRSWGVFYQFSSPPVAPISVRLLCWVDFVLLFIIPLDRCPSDLLENSFFVSSSSFFFLITSSFIRTPLPPLW